MEGIGRVTVWERLREYVASQSGSFTSQEAISWFRRHAPAQANERTIRTHLRGACWNVADRSQFAGREPFLTRIDRGLFRRATTEEVERWHAKTSDTVDLSDIQPNNRTAPPAPEIPSQGAPPSAQRMSRAIPSEEWHTEANVQASVVSALAGDGWRILSVANTATKEHGVDIVASRDAKTVGVEVKGFPSRHYADPARAGETKRTLPSTQAGHWYAQAVLAAMRLRGKEPTWSSVIALPDFPRYRDLHRETETSLAAAQIEIWWVTPDGRLHRP
ncbi:DUF7669 domain-containing protein [Ornithinimicrobium cerasi]|uniref:DUF7669 domain-containing protein n=1 Tax=Ornithinimicrobium cerasi TaxID=2248773 RepID=UPI00192A2F9E|nr:hypothetical protein [Ornithinimicrobium cerasi]